MNITQTNGSLRFNEIKLIFNLTVRFSNETVFCGKLTSSGVETVENCSLWLEGFLMVRKTVNKISRNFHNIERRPPLRAKQQ